MQIIGAATVALGYPNGVVSMGNLPAALYRHQKHRPVARANHQARVIGDHPCFLERRYGLERRFDVPSALPELYRILRQQSYQDVLYILLIHLLTSFPPVACTTKKTGAPIAPAYYSWC